MTIAAVFIGLLLVFLLFLTYVLMLVIRRAEEQEEYWRSRYFGKTIGGKQK